MDFGNRPFAEMNHEIPFLIPTKAFSKFAMNFCFGYLQVCQCRLTFDQMLDFKGQMFK
jgi:hypothetical protein